MRAILVATVLLFGLTSSALAQPNLSELAKQSTFVVQGTVLRLGAATMPIVPVSDKTIVVKVAQVHQAPKTAGRLVGSELTILVKDATDLKVGDQVVFFAEGWLLGDGIAVKEVGRLKGKSSADLSKQLTTARQSVADQALKERIAGAELVVTGKVASVGARAPIDPTAPVTEHDPQWQEAVIEVSTVLKGDPSLKRVVVVFPGSLDVAWANAPKFKGGQAGVWILRHDDQAKGLTALDPIDFQPDTQVTRIRRLVKDGR